MGELKVNRAASSPERRKFIHALLNDVEALDLMLQNGMFEEGIQRIGAEQEFCIVDEKLRPSPSGPDLLKKINDPRFTTELARFNLELNLDPFELKSGAFRNMEDQARTLLEFANQKALESGNRIVLTGILPTLRPRNLEMEWMTPVDRYHVLADALHDLRGEDFNLHLSGIDELRIKHQNILFEACNTSFQVHLQIAPSDFVDQYNWAQTIAGPVLSVCTNSPVLLGRELWSETRIALFRQSIDLRSDSIRQREKQPRVYFGDRWINQSVSEIFKDDIARHNLLITAELEEDSLQTVKNGGIPPLKALRLHNGTIYKWNRACYGIGGGKAHLRIECRYIPSGPTLFDEMANAAFWVGLMKAMPSHYKGQWHNLMNFKDVRGNFIRAARNGLHTEFDWFGRFISARALILEELLPMARMGLASVGISPDESKRYLQVIEARVRKHQTGSDWMIKSLRELRANSTRDESLLSLTAAMIRHQRSEKPVHTWPLAKTDNLTEVLDKYDSIENIMSTDLFTVNENDPLELVKSVMNWREIHHLPVENDQGELCGIISASELNGEANRRTSGLAGDIMVREIAVASPETSFSEAMRMMANGKTSCLPVTVDSKLVGIITSTDVDQILMKDRQVNG